MSTTQSQLKTISDEPTTTNTDNVGAELATIVGQAMHYEDLPDWDVYCTARACIQCTIEHVAGL